MKTTTKIGIALIVLLVAGGTAASEFIPVHQVETTLQAAGYTTNAGEITQEVLVGQTFVAQKDKLSGVAVMFATYSGRANTPSVEFRLREFGAPQDIRTVQASAAQLGDNQFYRFEFEPIEGSLGKTYLFTIVSPAGGLGNAVTVDLNSQDPYHLGTAFIAKGPQAYDLSIISEAGKPTLDVVFETYHTVPLREAVWVRLNGYVRTFIATWDEKQGTYWLWLRLVLPGVAFLISVGIIRRTEWGVAPWLGVFFALAVVMRVWYGASLPVTLDEGNYLYDAWTLLQGRLAGGDGYVKSPLVVGWIAMWEFLFRNTILAGRLSSIVASALTLFPLYMLGRDLFNRRTGLVVASAWTLLGPAVVFGVYVHTQPVALLLAVLGLALLLSALKGTVPLAAFSFTPKVPATWWWFVLAGVLLGMGVASRKSVLALGLVPLLLISVYGKNLRLRANHLIATGAGFLVVLGLFVGLAYLTYGEEGVWEALGANSAEDGINVAQEDAELIRAYSIRGMTPFFRESMIVILLAMLGLGVAGERVVRAIFQYLPQQPSREIYLLIDKIVPKLGWLPALLLFVWAWSFFLEYEGAAFHIFGIPWLWWAMAGILLLAVLLPRLSEDRLVLPQERPVVPTSTQPVPSMKAPEQPVGIHKDFFPRLAAWLTVPLWLGGLVVFYTNWIKFHANYIAEFIPPLILLSGVGVMYLFDRLRTPLFLASDYPPLALVRRLGVGAVWLMLVWLLFVSQYITYVFEHTGTFDQGSAREAAAWAQENIPPEEEIFTGAALIPYLSGHRIALDIAHPRWYAYEFTRKDTERLNTFLPPAEEMVAAFKRSEWFLLEQQTAFSFLAEYSDIERGLAEDFRPVQSIENGSNTLTFYRRVRSRE